MIIEFIGCTGSGKTTLIRAIQEKLAYQGQVTSSSQLVNNMIRMGGITNATAQNLIQEIICLPYFLRTYNLHKDFIRFTVSKFIRNTGFSIYTINNLRSLERKIGVYEICKQHSNDRIILVDEGPILAAHMFVYSSICLTLDDVESFVRLLPLPDLIIYVRAPTGILLERTFRRSDPPREMSNRDQTLIEDYVVKAVRLFDQISEFETIQTRLLTIENHSISEAEYQEMVNHNVEYILQKAMSKNLFQTGSN